jgi:glycosyltransferase involved in cell wall biosynthesis
MPEPRLSVLIVARNEEQNLSGCLASARFADERVVVVDAASYDATLEIARAKADIVSVRAFDNFADQRNAALALASGEWVLAIDGDERVTPELALEIRRRLAASHSHVGFRVPIRSEILGRPFGYSGTQHDLPLRLFKRDRGRWIGQVHETVAIDGPIGQMLHVLEHRTLPDIRVFLRKIDQYTTLEASDLNQAGCRYRTFDLTFRPVWTFLKLYLSKQGFRDGVEGLMFCALSGLSVAVRTWKLRELERSGPYEISSRSPNAPLELRRCAS